MTQIRATVAAKVMRKRMRSSSNTIQTMMIKILILLTRMSKVKMMMDGK